MARYEFVEGTSRKFWEAEVQGAKLHLRWGRLGTEGQSTVKAFASAAAATAEHDKLVREKTRKGYLQVGTKAPGGKAAAGAAPTSGAAASGATADGSKKASAGTAPPERAAAGAGGVAPSSRAGADPNAAVIPESWRKRVHPRRGYPSAAYAEAPNVDGGAAWKKLSAHYAELRDRLLAGATRPVADAARTKAVDARMRAGAEPADAITEGALGAIARFRVGYSGKARGESAVDHWVAARGVAFAVDAALHSLSFGMGVAPKSRWRDSKYFVLSAADDAKNAKSFDSPGSHSVANDARPMLLRLRQILARASDADYAAAREVAGRHRGAKDVSFVTRVAASYLLPTERAWAEADVADWARARGKAERERSDAKLWVYEHLDLLLASITRWEDYVAMNAVKGKLDPDERRSNPFADRAYANLVPTLVEGLGVASRDVWKHCLTTGFDNDGYRALACLPDDEALALLIDNADDRPALTALAEAVSHFPERAARVIGRRVREKGEHWKKVQPLLALAEGAAGAAPGAPAPRAPVAAAGDVPKVLLDPPWARAAAAGSASGTGKKTAAPAPVRVERLAHPRAMRWEEGERERFLGRFYKENEFFDWYLEQTRKYREAPEKVPASEWQRLIDEDGHDAMIALLHGPLELSRAWLVKWRKEHGGEYSFEEMHGVVARHELGALDEFVLPMAAAHPPDTVPALLPYDVAEIAPIVARVGHVKKLKPHTEGWLARHPRAAAVGLIPDAIGGDAAAKKAAVAALQVVDRAGHGAIVREVAAAYGPEVARAIDALLGSDPRLGKIPAAPKFWTPGQLPPVLLKTGGRLPPEALENLRIMLTLNELDHPFPGLGDALAACDPASLEAFGWAVFERWVAVGAPGSEGWALKALGVLGGDDTVRRLTPLIRRWPGESGHARATLGLEVLGAIGTDLALTSIQGIAERLEFQGLKERAQEYIARVAKKRNLGVDELADRLVPTLGLDARGTLTLDYGGRRFSVGFDEALTPVVIEPGGKRAPALPKPAAGDDAARAKEAQANFAALKKDVRSVASIQVARLERAMVTQRRWSAGDWRALIVEHPLLGHLARRLVWGVYDGERPAGTVRIAEDGSPADVRDASVAVADGRRVGIVHPLELDEGGLRAWSQVFADYKIAQPFPQLGRGRFGAAEASAVLRAVVGTALETRRVLGLTGRGWARGAPQDSGYVDSLVRESSIGTIRLELAEGFIAGAVSESPKQTPSGFFVGERALDDAAVARLGAIEASELAFSVQDLRA